LAFGGCQLVFLAFLSLVSDMLNLGPAFSPGA